MKLFISVAMLTALNAPAYAYDFTDSRGYHHWCQSSCGHPHFAKHFPKQARRHVRPGRHYRIRVVKDRYKFRQIDDEAPVTQQTPVLPTIDTVKIIKQVKEPPVGALQPVEPEAPKAKENIRMIKPIVNGGPPPNFGDIVHPWAKRIEDR